MKLYRMWLVGSLAGIVASFAWVPVASGSSDANDVPEAALQACKERSVEGSQYSIGEAELVQATQIESDRYELQIKSPAGNILCRVTHTGEIFTADEVEGS